MSGVIVFSRARSLVARSLRLSMPVVCWCCQLLAACLALGVTIDPEEERALEAYNHDADEGEMEVTLANIAGLTVDCLATFVPTAYVWR